MLNLIYSIRLIMFLKCNFGIILLFVLELVFISVHVSPSSRIFKSQRRIYRIITEAYGHFVHYGSHAQPRYFSRRP